MHFMFDPTHHDHDRFGFDFFGTCRVAQSVGRLGQVGAGGGDTGDLGKKRFFFLNFIVPNLPCLGELLIYHERDSVAGQAVGQELGELGVSVGNVDAAVVLLLGRKLGDTVAWE